MPKYEKAEEPNFPAKVFLAMQRVKQKFHHVVLEDSGRNW